MPMLMRLIDAILMLIITIGLIWFGSSAFGSYCPPAPPIKPPPVEAERQAACAAQGLGLLHQMACTGLIKKRVDQALAFAKVEDRPQ